MGYGKTSAAINYINSSDNSERFIFVTPYLNEVDRVVEGCKEKNFRQPSVRGSKLRGLKWLLEIGANIAFTHKLFSLLDKEAVELIKSNGYTLFLDEAAEIAQTTVVSEEDLRIMLDNFVVLDGRKAVWIDAEYTGKLEEYKTLCDLGQLYMLGTKKDSAISLFPYAIFDAFKKSYVMTYMFPAQLQKYYYDATGVKYEYAGVSLVNGEYVLNESTTDPPEYMEIRRLAKKLITVCDSDSLNEVGYSETALSKSWYQRMWRKGGQDGLDVVRRNTYNFFRNYSKTASAENMWTTFSGYRKHITGSGYTKGFVSCNARATNEYRERTAAAYLVNRYMNPYMGVFFKTCNVEVDEDLFALSEMLQWLWRSAIREGKPIHAYIPSRRMRTLLLDWMDGIV